MAVGGGVLRIYLLIRQLIQRENEELEFKTSFGRETIETPVAFANAKGGSVLVGVSSTEKVGVSVSVERINQVKAVTSPSVVPDIEIL